MLRVMRLNDQGLKTLDVLYDNKMLKFLVGGDFALMPMTDNIGALMMIRPTVGIPSWGRVQRSDDWFRAWGTVLFVKYFEGKPVSLTEEDYFTVRSRVELSVEEPQEHATG